MDEVVKQAVDDWLTTRGVPPGIIQAVKVAADRSRGEAADVLTQWLKTRQKA